MPKKQIKIAPKPIPTQAAEMTDRWVENRSLQGETTPPEQPKVIYKRLTLDVPIELHRRLKIAASVGDTTMLAYVLDAIVAKLERDK